MILLNVDGRTATLWMLVAFVVAFGLTRTITLMIRAGRGPFRDNVTDGGVHVHHMVYGIFSMMGAGVAEFALRPGAPWYHLLAALFGVGAALTLDEYALWFYLKDVYWAEEGRKSVDIAVYTAGLGMITLITENPFAQEAGSGRVAWAVTIAVHLVFALVCAYKGKGFTAVAGVMIPVVAIIGAVRVAKPGSPWARRYYKADSRKMAKSEKRRERELNGRTARLRDALAGTPQRRGAGH
ncbi:integral membrane protein [Catenulispora acidiphila DSM 44928]|uniref:Integral membrane protein n=1 Tax=Catenulispora acidiphila (strain DSM 44928 / JCM 14897 / NBRC 102108 / NRRL B-24433 / ID139908) TaxID=479433 RepID=C7QAC8_CATAD|nr:hypothetical protein [Catenulispora acidiphila]ACU72427.1 integral membrane protein [Catenulispora acidiphila DSM 44928]